MAAPLPLGLSSRHGAAPHRPPIAAGGGGGGGGHHYHPGPHLARVMERGEASETEGDCSGSGGSSSGLGFDVMIASGTGVLPPNAADVDGRDGGGNDGMHAVRSQSPPRTVIV
jgi:hypothetical protein